MRYVVLPNCHDATLLGIEVGWAQEAASASVRIELFDGPVIAIEARGVLRIALERGQPWGPSDAINDASMSPAGTGPRRLSINMQTGDPIEMLAEAFEIVVGPSEPTRG